MVLALCVEGGLPVPLSLMMILIIGAGLVIGSFLNVLIARSHNLISIVTGRSNCPHCHKNIAWYDLLPVLSFIFLAGRCRSCRKPISWQYPIIELLTALLGLHLYLRFGLSWLGLGYFVIFSLVLVISVVDIYHYEIPDQFMLPALFLAFILFAFNRPEIAQSVLWGVLLAGGGLAILVLVSKERWMGAGDIGFGLLLGLLAGFLGSVVGLVIAFFAGALLGLGLLLFRRRGLKDMIPFGPFLAVGCYVATLYGYDWAMAYLRFIHYY